MKVIFEWTCEFRKALVYDFGKIDAKIHHVLAHKFDFPPFDHVPTITEGFQEMNLGATSFPELRIMYKKSQNSPKYFIPVTTIHHLTKKQLDVTLTSVQRSKHIIEEVKFEISRMIKWLFEVRKLWWIIIKFLKMNQ